LERGFFGSPNLQKNPGMQETEKKRKKRRGGVTKSRASPSINPNVPRKRTAGEKKVVTKKKDGGSGKKVPHIKETSRDS